MRILGGQGSTAFCAFAPCGCATPTETLSINGVDQPDFLYWYGCAETTMWTKTYQGAEAQQMANGGQIALNVNWGNNPFAIDYSRVVNVMPAFEVSMDSGNNQRGVIGSPVEKPLAVKVTSSDPTYNVKGIHVTFEIVSVPSQASGHGIGADDNATTMSYSAAADEHGIARATLVVGNKQGSYTVRVKSPLSVTGNTVDFTATGMKPASVWILKDSLDPQDKAGDYAVSSTDQTTFYVAGFDSAGQKIGPIKSNWDLGGGGNQATQGAGTVSPTANTISTAFTPTAVGKIQLSANPVTSGIATGKANLFVTKLYVSVQNTFSVTNPQDDSAKFIPGMYLDGSNVSLDVMGNTGQFISLHVLTGGSKGKATFTVDSTNYRGIANNWPVNGDTSEDMVFTNGQQSITVDFDPTTGDTWTTLLVRDFGASGTIRVSMLSGRKTYELPSIQLPVDANADGMPEAKWYVVSSAIDPAGLLPDSDGDNDNGTASHAGDGLSAWEEMRGIVIGQHLIGQSGGGASYSRLDPRQRDLFIVADPEILASGPTPVSYLTPLPLRVHYLFPQDVLGTSHNNRLLTAIRPVVNPNRLGIPGARPQGQRAIRVINQVQYPPTVVVEEQVPGGAPIPHIVPTWQATIFGATILDGVNPDQIDQDVNGNPIMQFNAQSPDGTSFVEVYAKTFENSAIHTTFAEGLLSGFFDEFNNPVPQCTASWQGGCDIWEQANQLILPQVLFGGPAVDELHTVPRYPGEYYSKKYVTCAALNTVQPNGFSQQAMQQLRAAVAAHEIGHGMHMPHTLNCGELMFDANLIGINRTMADILPVPTSYSSSDRAEIRLWQ